MIEAIVKCCAGLDVHKMVVVATVVAEQADGSLRQRSRQFRTFRAQRQALCGWLQAQEVELAVMESTGNYWKSIYAALESAKIEAYVVNARHVKQVPGRKTDLNDSQWLASLGTSSNSKRTSNYWMSSCSPRWRRTNTPGNGYRPSPGWIV